MSLTTGPDQLAPLLRAVARLRPPGPLDPALVDALAALIAPAAAPQTGAQHGGKTANAAPESTLGALIAQTVPLAIAAARTAALQKDPTTTTPPARQRSHDPDQLVARASVLQQLAGRADLAAPTRGAARSGVEAQRSSAEAPGAAAPLESLFAPGRVRAILRELATVSTPNGDADIAAAVALIARAEPVATLPRKMVSALGHSVHLLFDTGPAMLPFSRDKQQLAASAMRLLGKDRVRVADFIGGPQQGLRGQGQVRWAPMHWPGRGSAVMVISDLGIGAGSSAGLRVSSGAGSGVGSGAGLGAALASLDAWQGFQSEARRRGLRSVVLIPYPSARWPASAAGFGTALAWDAASGVQALRRSARAHAGVQR